jgi:cytochrome c-type biogenesis protein CcmH/NrfG
VTGRGLGARLATALAVAMLWTSWAATVSAQQPPVLDQARALYDAGRLREARALLEDLLRAQPGDGGAHLLVGVIERTMGDLPEAIVSLERAHALEPESSQPAVELATTLAWHGDLDRAVALYQQVLDREPSHIGARVGLAFALAWQGHLERARSLFRELLGANPLSVDAWNGLGFVDRAALRREDAEAAYQRALELDPQNKDATAALKELRWDRRAVVRALGGRIVVPGADSQARPRIDVTYELSPGVTIGGGYQRYAFGAVLPIGGGEPVNGRTEDSLEADAILRPSRRFTLGNSIYTFFSDETKRGVVWEEAVFALTGRISLIGDFRPAFSSSEPHWLLAGAVGTTIALTTGSRIGVRALVAADTAYEPRLTLLADYGASFSRRFQMQLSAAHSGSDERFAFTSVGATATWLMTPSVGLTVIASDRTGTFERSTILLGIVVRR